MSKVILAKMTCKELREVTKKYNISGRWDMTKDQLIEAIEEKTKEEVSEELEKLEDADSKEVDNKHEKKVEYIERVDVGVLVAFMLPNGKAKTGKLINRSSKRRMVKLVTEYGAEFLVKYEDIIWVRTGKRWPRGVYNLLKGIKENEEGKKN